MSDSSKPIAEHRPETLPVYELVVRTTSGGREKSATVGIKNTGFDIYLECGIVLHYDLEGRLLRVADPPLQWRRGLSHRTVRLRRRPRQEGAGFTAHLLDPAEADALVDRVCGDVKPIANNIAAGHFSIERHAPDSRFDIATLTKLMHLAARFDSVGARKDVATFQNLYGAVPILPPDQYHSLVLMATDGCRYNRCTFCGFYRNVQYREKAADEFQQHVLDACSYHGLGLARRRGIFLGQANALIGTPAWRTSIFRVLNRHFEFPPGDSVSHGPGWWQGSTRRFAGITSFLDAFTGAAISAIQFAELRALHLHRVLIGMESGDPELLRWLQKPGSPEQILRTVQAAKAGGVQIGLIVLVGAGGEAFFARHVRETVDLVRAMQLESGDCVYLSPLITVPDADYADRAARRNIRLLTPSEMAEQERLIRAGLNTTPSHNGPYVAHYEVEHFIY